MRGPLQLTDWQIGRIPPRFLAAVRAVVEHRDSPCLSLDSLEALAPGVTADAVLRGWLEVWHDHADGTHLTLTPWAAAELGLGIVETLRVVFVDGSYEEVIRELRITQYPDGSYTFETLESTRVVRQSIRQISEVARWGTAEEAEAQQVCLPRIVGLGGMTEPDLAPAPPEPEIGVEPDLVDVLGDGPDHPEEADPLVIMGVEADPLRPRPRPGKARAKRRKMAMR